MGFILLKGGGGRGGHLDLGAMYYIAVNYWIYIIIAAIIIIVLYVLAKRKGWI